MRHLSPDELIDLVAACGLHAREAWWNYASTAEIPDAQFFTAIAEHR